MYSSISWGNFIKSLKNKTIHNLKKFAATKVYSLRTKLFFQVIFENNQTYFEEMDIIIKQNLMVSKKK
tara:strand:+ start:393 stop:596 length:204 start_codon:yes stop_codon:yes gene_type:complete